MDGQTATNPQTGEKVVLQGGRWVPMGAPSQSQTPGRIYGAPDPMAGIDRATALERLRGERLGNDKTERDLEQPEPPKQGGGNFKDESSLRTEFSGLPSVKNFETILPLYASAIRAGEGGAGDVNIIYALAKAMDPGSVVREGELQIASSTGSAGERLKGYFKQVRTGGSLTPEVRQGLLNEMRNRASAAADAYNQQRSRYGELAQRYNIDPEVIIGPHPGAPFQQAEADFLGRPVVNRDGSQGASPRQGTATTAPGQVVFNDQMPDDPNAGIPQMSPDQVRAYDAFLASNPNVTAEQLESFGARMGFPIRNAQEIIDFYRETGEFKTGADAVYRDRTAEEIAAERNRTMGRAGADELISQGATLGLSDEAAGAGEAILNVGRALFSGGDLNVGEAYRSGRNAERMRLDDARGRMGGLGTGLEIAGGLLSGNVSNALVAAPTLGGRIAQGAKAGSIGGGVAGFGYGEGAENSLLSAAGGAAIGGTLGAALPVGGAVVSNRVDGARRLLGKDPAIPRRLVSEAIEADGNTPRAVGALMDDARGRGSPMMLADTGDNARGLLASVSRQQGGSKAIGKTAVIDRQKAQAERISDAVVRDLGPTANIREMGDELIEKARVASRPHYDAFEAAPGASSVKLDDLATRPAFQKALKNARNIAAEEGADPTALGFDLDEAGEVILTRVPDWKTLDLVKRGMDDVIEGFRDSTTRKLNLNTSQARATNATLRTLVSRMDKVNQHYAAARAAYAGPAKMREALDLGFKALNKRPDDIMAMMKNMGESEKESFRLGVRKAIVDLLGSRKDGGDKVSLLIGSPKSRAVLTRVFGSKARYDRFIQTLRDEEAMGQTYKAVATGSPTAERMAADATSNDGGLAETAFDAALRGSGDTMWSSLVAALQKLRDVDRFGAGKAGESARESVAALLTETDPGVLRELMVAARKAAAQQRVAAGRKSRNAVRIGRNTGQLTGMGLGSMTEQPR